MLVLLRRLQVIFLLFSLFYIPLSHAVTIDKIIVFGDSLSDNGNIYSITMKLHKILPPIPIIPKNPPYFEGRFSNGPNWIDNVAEAMNTKLADYAYGGSWSEPLQNSGQLIPFSLGMQVNFYLVKGVFDRHKENHLYVIWSGSNDYLQGRDDPEFATTNTVATIKSQITSLIYYGAKHFLILGLSDLSGVPEVIQKGPVAQQQVKELSLLHNQKLFAMVEQVKKDNPDVQIVTIDVDHYMQDVLKEPQKYNLKNLTEACYKGGYYFNAKMANSPEILAAKQYNLEIMNNVSLRTAYLNALAAAKGQADVCDKPEEYLYWDQVHTTSMTHHILAVLAISTLNDNDIYGPANV